MTGGGSASGSRGRYVTGPRLFIQFSIGLSRFLIQQFWKCRDGLLAVVEPSLRRQNRQLVVVDELVRQSDQRELVRDRVFVERVFHDRDRDACSFSTSHPCRRAPRPTPSSSRGVPRRAPRW